MFKFLGKGSVSSIVIGLFSAVVVDIMFNEKVMATIKRGIVKSGGLMKDIGSAGADAYRKNRNKF